MSARKTQKVELNAFLIGKTMAHAAQMLGVTQSAISQASRSGREIYVIVDSRGRVVDAIEVVKFNRARRKKSDDAAHAAAA